MGMFDRLFGTRASAGNIGPPRDPVVAAWFGQTSQSSSGMNVTPDTALTVTAVYRAVSLLAQTYASIPIIVGKYTEYGGVVPDPTHPAWYPLVKRPNRWQTSFEWREQQGAQFALYGRCYSEIISTSGKAVSELVPLHPSHVRPFRAPDGKLAFEYSPLNGPARIILQDEMCFLHGITLSEDGVTPLSPIAAAGREAIGNAMAMQEHSGKLFANGTRLGGLLKMPGHLADDTMRKRLLDGWNRAFGGTRNTGKTALLEDGLEWQPLGMTSEDAQVLETMQFSIADISRIFGVPPHLLSDLSRATFGNIEEQGIEFVTHTIRPGAVRREEAFERDLLFGRSALTHCVQFDLDGLMRGNMAARSAFYTSMTQNGIKNRNECRLMEGDNPSPDEGMDKFTTQINMTTIDKVGKEPPKPEAPTTPPAARSIPDGRDTPIVMNVTMPEVRSPDVTVNIQPVPVPDVHVTVAAPEVRAPDVHVSSPVHVLVPEQRAGDVIVNVPQTQDMRIIEMPKRVTRSEIERDNRGDITSTIQTEKDV